MKKKQARRLLKAAKKLNRIRTENLSNDQVINNFEYMLKTYKLLNKGGKNNEESSENN